MFTLGETAALLNKKPEWLGRFVTRNPVDDDGRPYSVRLGTSRRFSAEGIKRLESAVRNYDLQPGFIYFLELYGMRCIKIGIAEDWHKRIQNLQTASPIRLKRLMVLTGCVGMEAMMHQHFADLRMRGEWFRDDPRIREFIGRCQGSRIFVVGEEEDA